MEKQVIFEYRVSGFYTDTISTHEKDIIQDIAKSQQQQNLWSFSKLFSSPKDGNKSITASLPWHVCLESSGGHLVAFLQVLDQQTILFHQSDRDADWGCCHF
jgi:hypothetical protein